LTAISCIQPQRPGQLRDGFRYAAGVPEIIRPLILMALVGVFAFEFEVSLPLLAHDTFQGGADAYSRLLSAFGAGAVIGGVYAAFRLQTGVVRLGHFAFLYAAAMMALALAPTLWPAVGASALVGLATILFLTTGNATVQLASDPHYRGRVMALWSTALVGSAPTARRLSALSPRSSTREPPSHSAHSVASLLALSAWPVSSSIPQAWIGARIKRRLSFPRSCIARNGEKAALSTPKLGDDGRAS
jgi:Transmembrane secretion effector